MNDDIKKVAAVHDLSGLGRCSLTAAIPVLSAMGLHCCPLPTAVLSNQTGFKSYSYLDFTPFMPEYISYWQKHHVTFDTIYTGFLGSEAQIDVVIDFISRFKTPGTLVLVDPVFGDNGIIYPTFSQSICQHMKRLVRAADIVVPNLTEAAFLSGYSGQVLHADDSDIAAMAEIISQNGPKKVVITGAVSGDRVTNHVFDFTRSERYKISSQYSHRSYSGTGDIFASIVCGSLTRGIALKDAVTSATDFVEKCVNYTDSFDSDTNEGVFFEKFLKELVF